MVMALVAAAGLQGCAPGLAWLGGARAPFLLATVVYYALGRDAAVAAVTAFLAGLLHDGLSGVPLGCTSLLYLALAGGVRAFRRYLDADALVTYGVIGGAGTAAAALVTYAVLRRADLVASGVLAALHHAAGAGVLGLGAAPAVYLALRGLDRAVGNVEVKEGVRGLR